MNEPPKATVLVIDDEPQIRRLLRITLEAAQYRVFEAADGKAGLIEAASRRPDLVLLDLGLPDQDGLAVLQRLREWSKAPVIILSVRDREADKVSALDQGADDYVSKPFSSSELLARIRVALRHAQPTGEQANFKSGPLEVDLSKRSVRANGKEIKLTPTEYSLLRLFVIHAGKVLTHTFLMREVWGPNNIAQTHYLRVYVKHLREKIEAVPGEPRLLTTEPGVGYRLIG